MAKEICISSTPHETRLAILEDDQLAEIYYERENEYTLAGSIYNGRVTRVLPGMQSAFVDLGLERDAFLYVTDFIELEDQAEAEELEQAAASGANQPPREVRRGNGRHEQRGRRGSQKSDQHEERQPSEFQSVTEPVPEATEPIEGIESASEQPVAPHEEPGSQGGRRWRGRRHRRSRGASAAAPVSSAEPTESSSEFQQEAALVEESFEAEIAPDIHAAAHHGEVSEPEVRLESSPRGGHAHAAAVPFVLPGESLSKYGGKPAPEPSRGVAERSQPAPQTFTSKPSTLIEAPLEWDGSGLLPGESIARHRSRQAEPQVEEDGDSPVVEGGVGAETAEPAAEAAVEAVEPWLDEVSEPTQEPAAEFEEEELIAEPAFEERDEFVSEADRGSGAEVARRPIVEAAATEDNINPAALPGPSLAEQEAAEEIAGKNHFPELEEDMAAEAEPEFEPEPETELAATAIPSPEETAAAPAEGEPAAKPEADASASHRVDPIPPSTFRLFGLGGKKKQEQQTTPAPEESRVQTTVAAVSAFAPGTGVVEEEVIEGEEYDAVPRHRQKTESGDFDDYEEETLASQIRNGGLGEMFQEAHLDHRIDISFGGGSVDEETVEEEEEEEEAAEAPSTVAQPRRERGGRTRRGHAGQGRPERRGPSRRSAQTTDLPVISDLLKPGQEILVQIAKEPIAKKGARITSHIALPGRFLVYMPTVTHVGVSRKIASDEERHRLKRILIHERGEAPGGFIVRTAAEGASEEELRADLRFLIHLWEEIKQRSEASKSPALIYHDLSLIERILRDQVSADFTNIWVDSEADYERIVRFLNRFSPSLVRRVKLYTKETPLFEHFGIQDEISKALRSKVWLKSGGSIVINQTEALVAIDINTGKYVGKSARLEDTILKTNLDAVPEIVRQIRLRDLGGIIVIDFIDMDERKNRYKVMAALEEALKSDRAPTKVLQFNDFGLVAITRKRVKQSLERTLSVPCPTCQATGMVKSPTTVCNEIWVEMRKMRKHFEGADVMLRVHPETVKVLKSNSGRWLNEMEELIGKNILVKSDATLHPEQFDIQG